MRNEAPVPLASPARATRSKNLGSAAASSVAQPGPHAARHQSAADTIPVFLQFRQGAIRLLPTGTRYLCLSSRQAPGSRCRGLLVTGVASPRWPKPRADQMHGSAGSGGSSRGAGRRRRTEIQGALRQKTAPPAAKQGARRCREFRPVARRCGRRAAARSGCPRPRAGAATTARPPGATRAGARSGRPPGPPPGARSRGAGTTGSSGSPRHPAPVSWSGTRLCSGGEGKSGSSRGPQRAERSGC
mmetsp:Transcript_98136/g.282118  ORF Transcript_98136/g.282118 Transcript_98136/m.282118 type:complete len:244 (-) Transcript_98136:781-1512(-)